MWWLRAAARDHALDATVSVLYEFAAVCDEAHGLGLPHADMLSLALVEVRRPPARPPARSPAAAWAGG